MKRIIIVLLVFSSILTAQDYEGAANWIFFGRQPSAKIESMGRIVALDYDNNFLSQSNPASLISSKGISLFYSQSSKYYMIDDLVYYFGGVSFNSEKYGAFALNVQVQDWGEFGQTSEFSPEIIATFKLTDQLYTFTYSNSVYNWFSIGINANYLRLLQGSENGANTTFFDLGLLRKFNFIDNSAINNDFIIGAQLKNIFKQDITFESDDDYKEVQVLPSIFNVGISNRIEYSNENIWKSSHLIGLTLGFEYQSLLNSAYRTALKFGSEISLLDVVYLRIGYYHETLEGRYINSRDLLKQWTYGFGFNFDLEHYLSNQFPLSIKIDYVNLPQPSYVTNIDDWDNFNTFSFIINYRFH